MNKYKKLGTIVAVILLIVSISVKFIAGGDNAAVYALPILCIGLLVMMGFDTAAYKTSDDKGFDRKISLMRLIAGYLVTILVTFGTVIFLAFRNN